MGLLNEEPFTLVSEGSLGLVRTKRANPQTHSFQVCSGNKRATSLNCSKCRHEELFHTKCILLVYFHSNNDYRVPLRPGTIKMRTWHFTVRSCIFRVFKNQVTIYSQYK